ncbi:MAG: hypothetical protein ACFFFC_15985, partial [Candidatus Thorarchaeota archaeon]
MGYSKPLLRRNPRRTKCIAAFIFFVIVWILVLYAALPIMLGVTNLGESLAWGIAIGLILVLLAGSV